MNLKWNKEVTGNKLLTKQVFISLEGEKIELEQICHMGQAMQPAIIHSIYYIKIRFFLILIKA